MNQQQAWPKLIEMKPLFLVLLNKAKAKNQQPDRDTIISHLYIGNQWKKSTKLNYQNIGFF